MVKGETYNLQLFESEAFRHFINVFTNKQSGITKGCELNINTQEISISKGYFFIQGGLLRETTGTSLEIPSETGFYTLVYEIDLSKTNTKDNFNQGEYKIIKGVSDFSNLTQQDLDDDGTIYQLPFCQFIIDEQGLSSFLDVRPMLNYGVYQEKGQVIYENENGISTSFQLNKTLEGASRIRVHYIGKHSEVAKELNCVKELDVIDGKVEDTLEAMYSGSINLWIMRTQISISGKAVILTNNIINGFGEEIFSKEDASIFITKIETL